MRQPVSFLTQSRFYSPAFNAAIFDGPIRIYFAQYQEALALKIYFELQENLKELYFDARESFKNNGPHIFLMIYPDAETFSLSFEKQTEMIVLDRLENDYVMGVRGPIEDSDTATVMNSIELVIRDIKAGKNTETAAIGFDENFDDKFNEKFEGEMAILAKDLEAGI